jgi:hypothetical protein
MDNVCERDNRVQSIKPADGRSVVAQPFRTRLAGIKALRANTASRRRAK